MKYPPAEKMEDINEILRDLSMFELNSGGDNNGQCLNSSSRGSSKPLRPPPPPPMIQNQGTLKKAAIPLPAKGKVFLKLSPF